MEKRRSIRDILLLIISALMALIALLVAGEGYLQWQKLAKISSLEEATRLSDKLFDTEEKLSVERDIAFSMLHAPDGQMVDDFRARLTDSRQDVDKIFNETLHELRNYDFPGIHAESEKCAAQFEGIQELRRAIDQAMTLPLKDRDPALSQRWFDEVTGMVTQENALWMEFIRHFTDVDPIVTAHMQLKYFLGIIMDYAGRERSLIGKMIIENADPTPQDQAQLLRWQGVRELAWNVTATLALQGNLDTAMMPYIKDAQSHYLTVYSMVKDFFYIPGAHHDKAYPISVEQWFDMATGTMDSMDTLKNVALQETQHYVDKLDFAAKRAILIYGVILLLALALCLYSFHLITRRVIGPINMIVAALVDAMRGKPVPFENIAMNQYDEIGKLADVLHAFQQNVEEIKHTSAMLKSYTQALERSNKELDDFAYIASHDLKEPLRGIHNYSRFLLEDNQDKLDKDSVSRLGRLIYLSQRMERLVNDLLYFSRLGRQELAIQSSDMNAVIHDIEATLDLFLAENHAHITIVAPMPTITCDKTRVTEVFRNLITNAVKYNDQPDKKVEIGFLESQLSQRGPRKNVFFVRDNGRGIDAEFYDEIFRIFKRLQSGKDSPQEGTGVGLTFVKKIIERHGGEIWLESQIGTGTTFYFTLGE